MAASPQELRIKHQRILEYLQARGLGAVVLTLRRNFAWYTGGAQNYVNAADGVGVATLVVTAERAVCVTSNIEAERIGQEELGGLGIEVLAYPWHDADAARRLLGRILDGKRAAADAPAAALPEGLERLGGDFDRLRWPLVPEEIERYRALGAGTAECLEHVCKTFPQGGTEFELAGRLSEQLYARGIRPHVLLVAADERIARFRHPIPTDRRIQRLAMVVVCAERFGLICSATRLFSFGPVGSDLRRRHEAVCRVDAAIMAATRPGRTLGDVWETIVAAYADVGFADEWGRHHQGGPTGYATREARALPASTLPVVENQAFAWNPSITGTKSEDTIVVTQAGYEILTASPGWPVVSIDQPQGPARRPDILIR